MKKETDWEFRYLLLELGRWAVAAIGTLAIALIALCIIQISDRNAKEFTLAPSGKDHVSETVASDEPDAENTSGIQDRIYTLENAIDKTISALYVYESKGENLVPDGLQPGTQIQVDVSGYYLHTPKETLYTVEFVADGTTYNIQTLHIEDSFNVLYLTGTDATSGATAVSFTNPDGSAQQVEAVEAPADNEIVTRTYTLENAMDTAITELYVYKSKGENLTPNGLKPGEQVTAEVFGYYQSEPNKTLYTVEFVVDNTTYSFKTLHIEDMFEVLYLIGAEDIDATSGATPIAFANPNT